MRLDPTARRVLTCPMSTLAKSHAELVKWFAGLLIAQAALFAALVKLL